MVAYRRSCCHLALLALVLVPALQGCGLSSITSGIGGGILGGGSAAGAAPKGVTEEGLLSAAKSDGDLGPAIAGAAIGCPQFLIWAREKHLTTYEAGRTGDGLAIIHQGEITKVARDCELRGDQINVKYGFSGRVLLGPKGQPGVVQLPVQMFVTGANGERVQTDTMKVDVAISPDNPIGYFSTVKVISFKVPEGQRPADYKLYVGFDKTALEPPAAAKSAPARKKN